LGKKTGGQAANCPARQPRPGNKATGLGQFLQMEAWVRSGFQQVLKLAAEDGEFGLHDLPGDFVVDAGVAMNDLIPETDDSLVFRDLAGSGELEINARAKEIVGTQIGDGLAEVSATTASAACCMSISSRLASGCI
jgi:hypothetical protein